MSAYSDLILAEPNLVAYWRFGETSGTAADASGNGYAGTVSGPTRGVAGLVAGDTDTAYSFDGTNDVVHLGGGYLGTFSTMDFATNNAFSAECSFTLGTSSNYDFFISLDDGTGIKYRLGWTNLQDLYWNMGAADRWKSGVRVPVSTPTHIIFTAGIESASIWTRVYINGSLATTQNEGIATLPNATQGRLGAARNNAGGLEHYFKGVIDDVSVYNETLSPAKVTAHYNAWAGAGAASGIKVKTGGTVADAAGYKAKIGGTVVDVTVG